jgi:hypothetical protein
LACKLAVEGVQQAAAQAGRGLDGTDGYGDAVEVGPHGDELRVVVAALGEVGGDGAALVLVQGVRGVDREQIVNLGAAEVVHGVPSS